MNNKRRKQLEKLMDQVVIISEKLEELTQEEQDYNDNMPEAFLETERGQKSNEAIYALENAKEMLENFAESIEEAIA